MESNESIKLFDKGVLLNLRVSMWSGKQKFTRGDMLVMGVDDSPIPEDVVSYGRKLLVSKEELQAFTRIQSNARNYINQFSSNFGISNTHFICLPFIENVEERLQELKEDFEKTVDSFVERFESIKIEMKNKHPEFWEKCLKRFYPETKEQLKDKFDFSWNLFKIDESSSLKSINMKTAQLMKQQMKTKINDFVEQYINEMRKDTADFCDLINSRINGTLYKDEEKPRKLTKKTLQKFIQKVEYFKTMNIFNDPKIKDMLDKVSSFNISSLTTKEEILDDYAVKTSMSNVFSSIKENIQKQDELTSSFIDGVKRKIVL